MTAQGCSVEIGVDDEASSATAGAVLPRKADGAEVLAWGMRLARAQASRRDARGALLALCDEIRTLVGCDRVQVWRGDIRQMSIRTVISSGFSPEHAAALETLLVPMDEMRLLRAEFLTQKVALTPSVDELPASERALFAPYGIHAAFFLLLERGDHVIGALQLSWCSRTPPELPHPELTELVRLQTALAVDFVARTDEADALSQTLSDTATLLARIHDPDELLHAIVGKVAETLGCDWASVHLFDEGSRRMRRVAVHGFDAPPDDAEYSDETLEWMNAQIAASEDGVLEIPDVGLLEPQMRQHGVSSYVSVPLLDEDRLVGSLSVGQRERTGRFARRQITLAKGLAKHALVALRNARLVRSLEEANQVKSDFVAAVSHDLRTPLHVLIGYNAMLLEGAGGDLNAAQSDLVRRMYDCSVHFLDLINGVLGLGRVEAGFDRVVLERVSLPRLCDELKSEVDYLRRPEVELRFAADPVEVTSDVGKLTTILRNLVTNALKFTTQGYVAVDLHVTDGALAIEVRDTGPGVAPEERPKVFEMFRQGAAGLRAGGSGLGLGLYLVQRLCGMLGGSIELRDGTVGETVFAVRIPLPRTLV
jgi:signal transduction histidine kinase